MKRRSDEEISAPLYEYDAAVRPRLRGGVHP